MFNSRFSLLLIVFFCMMLFPQHAVFSQYVLPNTPGEPDSTADTVKVKKPEDSLKTTDEAKSKKQLYEQEQDQAEPSIDTPQIKQMADTWVRHLLLRGWLVTSHIGAYSTYQLTGWNRGGGSYGPVEARISVYYLGTTEWMGKDAEWIQVIFRYLGEMETTIDYDFIVTVSADHITEFNRVLYRIDQDEILTGNFNLPEDVTDYDQKDDPHEVDEEQIRLYVGSFDTKIYAGSGAGAAAVYAYRATDLAPLQLVILGYGDKGLTLTSMGADARPRMSVPPPPSR
jgi:hypothetical protein